MAWSKSCYLLSTILKVANVLSASLISDYGIPAEKLTDQTRRPGEGRRMRVCAS